MKGPHIALYEWRIARELSQSAAAEMLQPAVSQAAWAAWEAGTKPPSLHNAFQVQRVTDGAIAASAWIAKPKKRTGTEG